MGTTLKFYLALLICCSSYWCEDIVRNDEDDDVHDNKFDNIEYALRGYNVRDGNPLAKFDNGYQNRIFLKEKVFDQKDDFARFKGITTVEDVRCERSLSQSSFTTTNSFR